MMVVSYNFSQGFNITNYFKHNNITEKVSNPLWKFLPNSYKKEFIGKFYYNSVFKTGIGTA